MWRRRSGTWRCFFDNGWAAQSAWNLGLSTEYKALSTEYSVLSPPAAYFLASFSFFPPLLSADFSAELDALAGLSAAAAFL